MFPFMLEQISQWKVCAQCAGLEEKQERGGRWWVKKLPLIGKGDSELTASLQLKYIPATW